MDDLTFIVEMTRILAWPGGMLVLASMFSPQIRKLLPLLKQVKAQGIEFDFSEELDRAEKTLPPTPPNGKPAIAPRTQSLVGAALPPGYIIVDEWRRVEERLRALARARGIAEQSRGDAASLAEALDLQGDTRALIGELGAMRAAAAHAPQPPPTQLDAMRYTDLVESLLKTLPAPEAT